ncbi:hypothetical protein D9757_009119 [Collybiopsis confluens]|uniref:Checkpoint protein n=1 Tax=Collybiopsis confluens TaxID=2823264 RepID=A0A8H5H988_9AGAR|nr:hypothetical protein D9757_009119 [Collybiopsis confluens]
MKHIALLIMLSTDQIGLLRTLIAENPSLVNAVDADERTPLHWAASSGSLETLRYLLDQKAEVDKVDGSGWSALHIAVSAGNDDIVEELVGSGADVNKKNSKGISPLHYAASKSRIDIGKLLISRGADINAKDKANQTPLHRAATTGSVGFIRLLLDSSTSTLKTRLNTQDRVGNTPLHLAMESAHAQAAVVLIEAGADRGRLNQDGEAPEDVDGVGGGIQVWSQIKRDSIFSSYRIQSNSGNEITVNISCEALIGALKSASAPAVATNSTSGSSYDTEEVIMKLAKKNDLAVLNIEVTGSTRAGRRVRIGHDVKIEVMKPVDVAKLSEPMCPDPDIHLILPSLQKLRTIVERLRPMSDVLAVRANYSGCLKLSINTESVKVDTEWKNLTIPPMMRDTASQDDPIPDPEEFLSVLVSAKSFSKFLNSHVVSTTTIACICQNYCLILYVYIGDVADAGGVLTFYIPAIIDDE